jgi:RNA polymerase sigma-70 factor (ECF subfamily)
MVDRLQSSALVLAKSLGAPDAAAARDELATPEQVFALVLRQVRALAGRRDVDELVQIAAEQALRSLPAFEGRSKLSTWTFRICYLTVRKHDRWLRRWLRRFTLSEDGKLPENAAEADMPDETMLRDERIRRVRHVLAQLSPKRRAVVVLYDMEGLSIEEIATIVDAHPSAVRSRLRDGRHALAQLLANDPYFGTEACRRMEEE